MSEIVNKRRLLSNKGTYAKMQVPFPSMTQRCYASERVQAGYKAILEAIRRGASVARVKEMYYAFVYICLAELRRNDRRNTYDALVHIKPWAELTTDQREEFWNYRSTSIWFERQTGDAVYYMMLYCMPMAPHLEVFDFFRKRGVINTGNNNTLLTSVLLITVRNQWTTEYLEYFLSQGFDWHFEESQMEFFMSYWLSLSRFFTLNNVQGLFAEKDRINLHIGGPYISEDDANILFREDDCFIPGQFQWMDKLYELPIVAYADGIFKFCIREGCPFDLTVRRSNLPFSLSYMLLYRALEEGVLMPCDFSCKLVRKITMSGQIDLVMAEIELAAYYGYTVASDTYMTVTNGIRDWYKASDDLLLESDSNRDIEFCETLHNKHIQELAELLAYIYEKGYIPEPYIVRWKAPRVDLNLGRVEVGKHHTVCPWSIMEVYTDAFVRRGFSLDKNEKIAKAVYNNFNGPVAKSDRSTFYECFPRLCETFLFPSKYYKTRVGKLVESVTGMVPDVVNHVLLHYVA